MRTGYCKTQIINGTWRNDKNKYIGDPARFDVSEYVSYEIEILDFRLFSPLKWFLNDFFYRIRGKI